MTEIKRKNIIIMVLCGLMVLMGVGYALLSQSLTINTTATINSTWDIRITNVEVASKVGYATDTTPTNNIADDGHSATITADLSAPLDEITYTVTVHNFGTIAGTYDVNTENLITPGAGQPSGIVTATTDVATSNSLKYLAPETGEGTFNVTLKFEDIDELPEVKEYSFTITPNFIQISESGVTPGGGSSDNTSSDFSITDLNKSYHYENEYGADYDINIVNGVLDDDNNWGEEIQYRYVEAPVNAKMDNGNKIYGYFIGYIESEDCHVFYFITEDLSVLYNAFTDDGDDYFYEIDNYDVPLCSDCFEKAYEK